jgi:hypothetical protein
MHVEQVLVLLTALPVSTKSGKREGCTPALGLVLFGMLDADAAETKIMGNLLGWRAWRA